MHRAILSVVLLTTLAFGCATSTQEEPAEEVPAAAAPAPEPEPEPVPAAPADTLVAEPVAVLPDTASPMPTVGLVGLSALGLAGGLGALRRRLD